MHQKLIDTFSRYDTIVLVWGGTGWHIQPIINISEELSEKRLIWIGGKDSNEETVAKNAKIGFESISTLKLSSTRSPKILLYPFILLRGIREARNILSMHYALCTMHWLCIFSKWWPGSVAVGIAAWSLSIPLYIHESDTIPGRSNRILGYFATTVFLGFESAKVYFNAKKCEVIGQILHRVFSNKKSQYQNIKHFISWKTDKKHLLIICGSQWARVIFEEILKYMGAILNGYEVILILGKLNTDMRKDFEASLKTIIHPSLQLLDWIDQESLASLIRDTDIAITRGSATTLAELTAFEKTPHLIIIPLPHAANNHQYYNALEYEKMWHTLLEQKNISTLTNLL